MPSRSLRNANIDYTRGWFFVTTQVAHNKSQFGVIVGRRCGLNELGKRVAPNVLDHAVTIWHGAIRPGGTLETLLRAHKLTPH